MDEKVQITFNRVLGIVWEKPVETGDQVEMKGELTTPDGRKLEVAVSFNKEALRGQKDETCDKIKSFFKEFQAEHLTALEGHTVVGSLKNNDFSLLKGGKNADTSSNPTLQKAVTEFKNIFNKTFSSPLEPEQPPSPAPAPTPTPNEPRELREKTLPQFRSMPQRALSPELEVTSEETALPAEPQEIQERPVSELESSEIDEVTASENNVVHNNAENSNFFTGGVELLNTEIAFYNDMITLQEQLKGIQKKDEYKEELTILKNLTDSSEKVLSQLNDCFSGFERNDKNKITSSNNNSLIDCKSLANCFKSPEFKSLMTHISEFTSKYNEVLNKVDANTIKEINHKREKYNSLINEQKINNEKIEKLKTKLETTFESNNTQIVKLKKSISEKELINETLKKESDQLNKEVENLEAPKEKLIKPTQRSMRYDMLLSAMEKQLKEENKVQKTYINESFQICKSFADEVNESKRKSDLPLNIGLAKEGIQKYLQKQGLKKYKKEGTSFEKFFPKIDEKKFVEFPKGDPALKVLELLNFLKTNDKDIREETSELLNKTRFLKLLDKNPDALNKFAEIGNLDEIAVSKRVKFYSEKIPSSEINKFFKTTEF